MNNPHFFYRGRWALSALLESLGIKSGDKVAIQAFTCLAVVEGLRGVGAVPVFVDVEEVNMNPAKLGKVLPEVRAVVVQHTFGIPAKIIEISDICKKNNVPLIEDCCHALFSTVNGRKVGEFGVGAFYSLEWGKPIVAGLGGISISKHLNLKLAELEANLAQNSNEWRSELQFYLHKFFYSPRIYWLAKKIYRLLGRVGVFEKSYNAKVSIEQRLRAPKGTLRRFHEIDVHATKELAIQQSARYESLEISSSFKKLNKPEGTVYSRYPLFVKNKQRVIEEAKKVGIEIAPWFETPIHPIPLENLTEFGYMSCPNAELASAQIISFPIGKKVSEVYFQKIERFLKMEF